MVVEYSWRNVVIGTTLSALSSAQKNNCPILFNKSPTLFTYKKIRDDKLECEAWQSIASDLAIKGLNPFGDKITSIRINADIIDVICQNKKYAICYKNIKFFDDDNIENFPFDKLDVKRYRVYDWFRVRSGAHHNNWILENSEDFVNKIYFFPKITLPRYKDCVAESMIEGDFLNHVDYTSTMARLKTIDTMAKYGILGTKHTKTYHLPIKLDFIERQVIKIKEEIIKEKDNYLLDTRELK